MRDPPSSWPVLFVRSSPDGCGCCHPNVMIVENKKRSARGLIISLSRCLSLSACAHLSGQRARTHEHRHRSVAERNEQILFKLYVFVSDSSINKKLSVCTPPAHTHGPNRQTRLLKTYVMWWRGSNRLSTGSHDQRKKVGAALGMYGCASSRPPTDNTKQQ